MITDRNDHNRKGLSTTAKSKNVGADEMVFFHTKLVWNRLNLYNIPRKLNSTKAQNVQKCAKMCKNVGADGLKWKSRMIELAYRK